MMIMLTIGSEANLDRLQPAGLEKLAGMGFAAQAAMAPRVKALAT